MVRCRLDIEAVAGDAAGDEVVCWDSNGNATCGIHGSFDDELADAEPNVVFLDSEV